jgi:uncharacterized Zn finger protein
VVPARAPPRAHHPGDAIPIYRRRIEKAVETASNRGYEDAVRLLPPLRALHLRAERDPAEFTAFVGALRATHKRKRNFIGLLDRARLE